MTDDIAHGMIKAHLVRLRREDIAIDMLGGGMVQLRDGPGLGTGSWKGEIHVLLRELDRRVTGENLLQTLP